MDNPDLQSILSSLARYATSSQPPTTTPSITSADALPFPTRSGSVSLSQQQPTTTPSVPSADALPLPTRSGSVSLSQHVSETPEDPRLRPQSRSAVTASPKPVIDPATITTWQEGIRCVTKIAAQNAQFAASIKKVRVECLLNFLDCTAH